MSNAYWFYIYDATNDLWLQDDEREWGWYRGAAEFSSYELAHAVALREITNKGPDYGGTVIVLGDFGTVEAK